MRGLFTSKSFQLAPGEALSGRTQQPQILRIMSGRAWVTIAGVSHDYWLAAGDTLQIARGRLVVVEAQSTGFEAETMGETAEVPSLPARIWRKLRRTRFQAQQASASSAQCCV